MGSMWFHSFQDLTRRGEPWKQDISNSAGEMHSDSLFDGLTDSLKFFYLPVVSWIVTKGHGNIICMFSLINFNPTISLFYPGEVVPHSSVLTL